MGGHRIVRARARRRQVEFLDGRLDRAGDQHGRRPRLFREALDQVGGDRIPVLLLHRRAEIAHHAGDGAPAFRRIAGGQPVDVVAAAAYPGDEFLAGAFREVLPRAAGRPKRIPTPAGRRRRAATAIWTTSRFSPERLRAELIRGYIGCDTVAASSGGREDGLPVPAATSIADYVEADGATASDGRSIRPSPAAGKRPISDRPPAPRTRTTAHECSRRHPGLQARPAVSRRRGHDALPQAFRRRRAGREDHGQGCRRGRARRVARPCGGGVFRHQSSAAAGASQAAARHPRRPRGLRQRQVRGLRFSQERQHRRRRRAADVPGHRHRHHHGQEGPADLDRRRRRGGARRRRPRRLPEEEPALFPARAALHVRGEEHQQQHAGPGRDLCGRRGCLQAPVHRQGRRLRQQVVPVPGDAVDPHPRPACSPS